MKLQKGEERSLEKNSSAGRLKWSKSCLHLCYIFFMLNGQALKKRQTVGMLGLCYACLGISEPFVHVKIPTFTATFGKYRVEMLLHRFALFFHCVVEVSVTPSFAQAGDGLYPSAEWATGPTRASPG